MRSKSTVSRKTGFQLVSFSKRIPVRIIPVHDDSVSTQVEGSWRLKPAISLLTYGKLLLAVLLCVAIVPQG